MRTVPELIVRKRDGIELTGPEIASLIDRFVRGEATDYQMAALAMAIFFRGMTDRETAALTLAMRDSGTVVDLSKIAGKKVDKHSTGGVGDKVSLCLAPMVAAAGVPVPMISGRGLGHTGGTLDKLEAIPGFSVNLETKAFVRQLGRLGCALIGQTADLAPADKKLYALRDVTGTVESIPLITASILSKKLAEGIDALVLDVKVGRGAFMKTVEEARALAKSLVRVGRQAGKEVTAILTDMESPLGLAIGNAIETAEAFDVLAGGGPADLVECTMVLGAEMLRLGGVARNTAEARRKLEATIRNGEAIAKMEKIVAAQGGDPRVVREIDRLPRAKVVVPLVSSKSGFVTDIDALELGRAAIVLGAGRTRADQTIDPAVGIVLAKKPGDTVRRGEPLAFVHAQNAATATEIGERIRPLFTLGRNEPSPRPLVLETIRR